MSFLEVNNSLCVEGVPLLDIARDYGTPAYVYSTAQIIKNFGNYSSSIRKNDKICFSVKSNSNIHILEMLANKGSGFDVVSSGELRKCLIAGGKPEDIVFSGVGKSTEDIELALEEEIFSINIESEAELDRIIEISKKNGAIAECSFRLNPNISSGSHPFIETGRKSSKFGLSRTVSLKLAKKAENSGVVKIKGIASHVGSQISKKEIVIKNLDFLIESKQVFQEAGISLNTINIGGGLGISYKEENQLIPSDVLKEVIDKLTLINTNLIVEPGRSIVGNTGILLTKLEYLKKTETSNFAIIDAGMNDLIRPSLYNAWHNIKTIEKSENSQEEFNIVGPICESTDVLGEKRELSLTKDSILAILDVGAYGHVMSSNYNSRPRPPEILVDDCEVRLIRRRESFQDLISTQTNL